MPRGFGEQKVLIRVHGIFEQPMDDDDIHASELHKVQDAMEQGLAAVDDDFEPEFFYVRAGITGAGGGRAQLIEFFAKHLEERDQLIANNFFRLCPGFYSALFAAKKKHGVAFELGNFLRQFNLMNDGLDQFGDDGLAVAERLGVRSTARCLSSATGAGDPEDISTRMKWNRKSGGKMCLIRKIEIRWH